MINKKDWYWLIGGLVYSSKLNTYVDEANPDYVTWVSVNGTPPAVQTEAEIWGAMRPHMEAWMFDGERFSRPTATTMRKSQLKAYAAQLRYEKEVSGFEVEGVLYPSDRDTQSKLTAAAVFAQVDPMQTFKWKLADGTFTEQLSAAQLTAVAAAVGGYVNQCFSVESDVIDQIEAGTLTTITQINTAFAAL